MYLLLLRKKNAAWLLYPGRSMLPQSGIRNDPPLNFAHQGPLDNKTKTYSILCHYDVAEA